MSSNIERDGGSVGKDIPLMHYPDGELRRSLQVSQYEMLRTEILQRLDLRQQIVTFTLLVASTLFGLGGQGWVSSLAILCFPLFALFFAGAWQQHDLRIGQIVLFLGEQGESPLGNASWEAYRWRTFAPQKKHLLSHSPMRGSVALPTSGIFIVSQLLAIGIGTARTWPISPENYGMLILFTVLVVADVVATLLTVYMLRHRRMRTNGITILPPCSEVPGEGGKR